MKKLLLLTAISIALGAGGQAKASIIQAEGTPAPSLSPVLPYDVNFDSIATGTLITPTLYAANGIASIANAGPALFTFAGTQSVPNYVGTGPSDSWAADITITFAGLQHEVGFGDAGPNTTSVTLRDATGTVLYTNNNFASAPNDYWYFTDTAGANIKSIEISSSFIAIDDVQYTNANVPEPASLALFGAGLLGLGLIRRKSA